MVVTYYVGENARITDEVFETWYPHHQKFLIGELTDIHVVHDGVNPVAVGAVYLGAGGVVIALAAWPFLHSPVAWLTAFAMVIAPSIVGGACWGLNRPVFELRASYRGYRVQLFVSRDERTFGQVKRALVRSLEAAGYR